jgi:hypothetical protein
VTSYGYYVDEGSGRICSTAEPPANCHFEFHSDAGFAEVWIVKESGEVHQENMLWPSLEAMREAGIDVGEFVERNLIHVA